MSSKMDLGAFPFAQLPLSATAVLLTLSSLLYLFYRWALPKPYPGIPYNEEATKSIWGDVPGLLAHAKRTGRTRPWFAALPSRHQSALVQIFLTPFAKPQLLLADYRETTDICIRRTKEFDRSRRSGDSFKGVIPNHHISMQTRDPEYRSNKELVKDLMTPKFLSEVSAPRIYEMATELVELWRLKADRAQGRPFSAYSDVHQSALDIINGVAFGLSEDVSLTRKKLKSLRSTPRQIELGKDDEPVEFPEVEMNDETRAILFLTEAVGWGIQAPLPGLQTRFHRWYPSVMRAQRTKETMIKREIETAMARLDGNEGEPTRSAMDHIIVRELRQAKKAGRAPVLHSKPIYDELFGFLVGGHDTTSNTLAWGLKLLSDNQESERKLREHLRTRFHAAHDEHRWPTTSEINRISVPYLDAVIEEILLHSAVLPISAREALCDTTLLGHHVPKGTMVLMYNAGEGYRKAPLPVEESLRSESSKSHKDTVKDWDPETVHEFRPERWLKLDEAGTEVYDSQSGPFNAFSNGPRGCFGRRLAYLQLRVAIVLLAWNFQFHKCPEALSSYDAVDYVASVPVDCYVSLSKID